ncbi:MAG: IS1380 family transposase [Firmicutes bacterium]|nr:IS1380 family transposase [Bacillota bacterium]
MTILNTISLESNKQIKINFNGGDLSSDAGLLLLKEFTAKIGLPQLLRSTFKTNDPASFRLHTDQENLMQMLYQIFGAYFTDDCADELTTDPVMKAVLGKEALASQPTLSRFHNRMDEDTLAQMDEISRKLRNIIYSIRKPDIMLFDLDSTLLEAYGSQEGKAFNYHYQDNGYHPLVCYDGMTGDLLKIKLRTGAEYTSRDVAAFMQPLFDEFLERYPGTHLFLRGDSGFATPELYRACETNGTSYAIRLKQNCTLMQKAKFLEDELFARIKANAVDYAVVYGEFEYQAASWDYPRRVVCKAEKPYGQLTHLFTFLVTNMDASPEYIVRFYCKRGMMENFIKESKNEFDFGAVSSSTMVVNANRLQIHALAYNLFNWFRRLVLPLKMRRLRADTIRLKLLKVAAKAVTSARYLVFKLCSSCPYKAEFYETLENISHLNLRLG